MRLLDIEGTVCPVTFVHDVLFPYARRALPDYVAAHPDDAAVREAAAVAGVDPADPTALVEVLRGWIDADRKVTALKAIQGAIWRQGYADGAFVAPLYPDVVPALDRWRARGEAIAVFSSGSVEAQQLLFGHTDRGDLRDRFVGWFDTTVGSKREPGSYAAIADRCRVAPSAVTFYSDVAAELDAARTAGMAAVGVARDAVGDRRAPDGWITTFTEL
ncbi:MAG: acireductone synthase [Myxococcota bacterium]